MKRLRLLVSELRRRHVFRVAGIYVVAAWVAVQVADTAFPGMDVPEAAIRYVWLAAFLGFPLVLAFGWRYDITALGIERTPPVDAGTQNDSSLHRTDYVILTLLAVIAAGVTYQFTIQISDSRVPAQMEITQKYIKPNSIAVLPLVNLSGDPEQAYFVEGMYEALIADLSRISGLKVISRTSTEQYRGSDKPLPEIGTELGVANVIEGSVFRAGDQVRITVQLIDAQTDNHLWAESYERSLTNVLRLQSNVAREIANQINVTLTPFEDTLLAASAAVDPEAYEFYLKGRFHWYKFTEADLKLALEYFELAIDKDPGYALAYVGFADALATAAHIGLMPTTQVYPAAKQSLARALELDGGLAEAHDLLARIRFAYDWDWNAAERGFRRSISLKPGYPDVHIVYSQFLAITNRWDESMDEVRMGLELDPLNPWFRLELAQRLAWFGHPDEAMEQIRELIKSQPDFWPSYKSLWHIAYGQGKFEEAITAASIYFRQLGENVVVGVLEGEVEDLEYSELMRSAADHLETQSTRPYISHIEHAEMRMHAGDLDKALDRLEQAHAQHESHLVYTIVQPLFRPVWKDERYQNLLREMNLN